MEKILGACFIVFLLCVSCSKSNDVTTEPTRFHGLTLLGLRSKTFDCGELFEMLDGIEAPAVSFLWDSFGEDSDCLLSFLSDSRPKSIQVFLVNAVRLRKGNCSGADAPGYDTILEKAMSAYDEIIPYIRDRDELIITPALEDDLKNSDFEYIANKLRDFLPEAKIGRNKNGLEISADNCAAADYCELHNEAVASFSDPSIGWSNDGYDLDLAGDFWSLSYQYTPEDVLGRVTDGLSGARIIYLWKASFNGLVGDSGGTVPPNKRTITISEHDREQIRDLLQEIQYAE